MNKVDKISEIDNQTIQNKYDIPEDVPHLTTFYLYMTTGCNLFCQHCWITPTFVKGKPTPGEFIDLENLKSVVKEAKTLGLNNAKFTGGEPLLHPQFIEILDYMSSEDLKLTMETNATLIDASLVKHMKKNSTMWFVSTSLDSHRPEFHDKFRGVQGAYKKTIKGIKHLVNAGYKPQIIMSPHRGNIDDVEDLVKLAVSLGAGSVKFNPVTPTGRGKIMHENDKTLGYDELITLVRYVHDELQDKYPIQLHISIPPALSPIRDILRTKKVGIECHVLNILGILGSGEIALCGIGRNIPELCFGELGKDSLREVWISHPTLVKLRKDLIGDYPGICGDCIHSHRCQTQCVAINYSLTGKLVTPYYLCEVAEKRGIFPETRRRSYNTNLKKNEK